ncbi:hypothetical protein [Arcanobacterium hippocoleae]|uniref:hypothetical protein n=1 Tax=Arcanobacterium hippocoleae TaxID=149017 RepID=UPI00333E4F92
MDIFQTQEKQRAAAAAKDLQTLSEEASSALLKTDDAVRSAAAEVEFARAEFGLQATQEFAKTLQEAKGALDHGFAIRRLLDDPDPETPAQQRQMNQEILALVQQADDALKAQQEDFQKLRDLAARVPEKLLN